MGEITADLLKKIGMTVDFVATDWGTVGQRRASKNPPGQGGWGMFHTWHAGADCANPAGHIAVRASGEKAWFGWPDDPEVEKDVAAWYDAKSLEEEKAVIARRQQGRAWSTSCFIPTGFYYRLPGLAHATSRASPTGRCRGSGASRKRKATARLSRSRRQGLRVTRRKR